ncbi:hypothetical protein K435DRAFT_834167 [Dendrothele bispora CBS 962.96]|uniref:DUF262 domain-containing protein n=1 Tax=Dendrothele bispora (strain CBS 962.96) TaxID=1314807 RepID=A0A4S8MUW8_DENBC|nr:hypothetical protein K435DRAFT_834167 [Dendrothele bispora CBS 962.96]
MASLNYGLSSRSTVKMVEIKYLYGLAEKYASVSPPREEHWSQPEQSHFVDSIWNHYPMNQLVFRIVDDGPNAKIICIDGKERLWAIKRFIDGTATNELMKAGVREPSSA